MDTVEVFNEDGSLVCVAEVADAPLTRMWGLLGRKSLATIAGLLITPCSSVHTFFMRFSLDVVYLDGSNAIVKTATMKPFRMSMGGKGAKKVLELPEGRIDALQLKRAQQLAFTATGTNPVNLAVR